MAGIKWSGCATCPVGLGTSMSFTLSRWRLCTAAIQPGARVKRQRTLPTSGWPPWLVETDTFLPIPDMQEQFRKRAGPWHRFGAQARPEEDAMVLPADGAPMRDRLSESAARTGNKPTAVCFLSPTAKKKLFTFLVDNFVDDGLQIRRKQGRVRLSQGCLHFTQ